MEVSGNSNVSLKDSHFRVATKRHGSSTTNEILCLCVCIYFQAIDKREIFTALQEALFSMCQRFSAAGMTTTGGHRMELEITRHVLECTLHLYVACETGFFFCFETGERRRNLCILIIVLAETDLVKSKSRIAGAGREGGTGCGIVKTHQQQQGLGRRDTRVTVSGESRSKTSSGSAPRNGRESPQRKQVRDLPAPRGCTRSPNPLQEEEEEPQEEALVPSKR